MTRRKTKTPEPRPVPIASGRRASTEEVAGYKEWLRKHPPKPLTRKDWATILRRDADRITEDAERFTFTSEPERAERYAFWRGLVRRRRISVRKRFPDITVAELPSPTGNDLDALADYCKAVAGAKPDDLITTAVAVWDFGVSRSTLRRAVKAGELRDYRPAGHAENAPYLLSRAEVASRWPRGK